MFLTESWFWRGTQSAIFYYVSCAPCVEAKYKRNRRREAERAFREKAEIVTEQPGRVKQPGPFETNPDWAEEIIMGPGPPKGWKKEKILQKYTEGAREKYRNETQTPQLPPLHTEMENGNDIEMIPVSSSSPAGHTQTVTFSQPTTSKITEANSLERPSITEPMSPISEVISNISTSTSTSDRVEAQTKSRPSMERRLSSAVENIKDTIKGWNLKRYDREDEILSGLTERIGRIWDKAILPGTDTATEGKKPAFTYGRKRAGTAGTTGTNHSDRHDFKHDWERAVRNPEINEMHPPTVSKLPATRDEAVWMLLPPPSAAVMAGRARPQAESPLRWPLAQIGRNTSEWKQMKIAREMEEERYSVEGSIAGASKKTPDLSHSSSEDGWTDDDEEFERNIDHRERQPAPIEGWMPIIPKPAAHVVHRPSSTLGRDEAWRAPTVY